MAGVFDPRPPWYQKAGDSEPKPLVYDKLGCTGLIGTLPVETLFRQKNFNFWYTRPPPLAKFWLRLHAERAKLYCEVYHTKQWKSPEA